MINRATVLGKTLYGAIPDGDALDFAERYYGKSGQFLLEHLNKEMQLHLEEDYSPYNRKDEKPRGPRFSFSKRPSPTRGPTRASPSQMPTPTSPATMPRRRHAPSAAFRTPSRQNSTKPPTSTTPASAASSVPAATKKSLKCPTSSAWISTISPTQKASSSAS